MIPIRNRKKTLKVTVEEMRNFAFAYVEKYAPSKQQLKTYLLKKYLKTSVPNVKKQDVPASARLSPPLLPSIFLRLVSLVK